MAIYLKFECDVCKHGARKKIDDLEDVDIRRLPPGWLEDGSFLLCSGKCYDIHITKKGFKHEGWTYDPKATKK